MGRRLTDSCGRISRGQTLLRAAERTRAASDAPQQWAAHDASGEPASYRPLPEASEDDRTTNLRDASDVCPWWMPVDRSADYLSYAQQQTWGTARLLINGRSSGGAGPNDDRSEPFDMMQFAVEVTNPGDTVYLSAWMFDPETKLTRASATAATTWGDLIAG